MKFFLATGLLVLVGLILADEIEPEESFDSYEDSRAEESKPQETFEKFDGFFQYANVPKEDQYEFGFNHGNPSHFISRYEQAMGGNFRSKVKWGDSDGRGEHYFEFNHGQQKEVPEPEHRPEFEVDYKPEYTELRPEYQTSYQPEYEPENQPELKPELLPTPQSIQASKPETEPNFDPNYKLEGDPEYKTEDKPSLEPATTLKPITTNRRNGYRPIYRYRNSKILSALKTD